MAAEEAPKWRQVYDYVAEGIRSGRTPAGSRIESASVLGRRFNASRGTVQIALTRLRDSGVLAGHQGYSGMLVTGTPEDSASIASQGRCLTDRMAAVERRLADLEREVRALRGGDAS